MSGRSGMSTEALASVLAARIRAGGAAEAAVRVVYDGALALAVEAILTREELSDLRDAVHDYLGGRPLWMVVGGEAIGGPVDVGRSRR